MNKRYPLIFGYRDLVSGNGYVAGVATNGRALVVEEDVDDFWVYGVNPGGIAGGGATRGAAHEDFRRMFKAVLYDIAVEAQSFEEFKQRVEEFFNDVNPEVEEEWASATQAFSAESDSLDLRVQKASSHPPKIEIQEVSSVGPSVNQLDEEPIAACA